MNLVKKKVSESKDWKKGAASGLKLTVVYLDQGPGTVQLVYDSSDEQVKVVPLYPGAWKQGGNIRLGQSGEWRQAEIEIRDAYFGSRCNGHDVRLQWGQDTELTVKGIYVKELK